MFSRLSNDLNLSNIVDDIIPCCNSLINTLSTWPFFIPLNNFRIMYRLLLILFTSIFAFDNLYRGIERLSCSNLLWTFGKVSDLRSYPSCWLIKKLFKSSSKSINLLTSSSSTTPANSSRRFDSSFLSPWIILFPLQIRSLQARLSYRLLYHRSDLRFVIPQTYPFQVILETESLYF